MKGFLLLGVILLLGVAACVPTTGGTNNEQNVQLRDIPEEQPAMEQVEDSDHMMDDEGAMMEEGMKDSDTMAPEFMATGEQLAGSTTPYLDFNRDDYESALAAGKTVFLYFYASWCPTCIAEQKDTVAAFNELQLENLVGFRVNYKDPQTDTYEIGLAREFGISYQHTKVVIKDGERVLKAPDTWEKARYHRVGGDRIMVEVTLIAAFIAGIISFLSPCVLPLIPAFLAYLSGTRVGEGDQRWRMFANSVAYVLGFSSVFAILGVLLNTVLEHVGYTVQQWLAYLGGAIIIFFGLYLVGLIKIKWLQQEHTVKVKKFNVTYVSSFIFGAAFAVGWSPCVGAVLGSIFALAVTQPGLSFWLLLAYALGLGIPFLVVGLFSSQALAWIQKYGKFLKYFNIVVGIFLIILGILVFTQQLSLVANLGFVNNLLLG